MASHEVIATKIVYNIGTLPIWLSAIGTLAAVIFAIYRDTFLQWLNRPKLDAIVNNAPPDCHKMSVMIQTNKGYLGHVDGYYFRIKIINHGKTKADNVEVYAHSLEKEQNDGNYSTISNFLPLNLNWTHFETPILPAISPGMDRHCNLGVIFPPGNRADLNMQDLPDAGNDTIFSLALSIYPTTLSHLIKKGKYRLHLKIAASNSAPVSKIIEIEMDGAWADIESEMLNKHIRLCFK
jgi:hypothetical protein